MPNQKKGVRNVKGKLKNWSLISQFNTNHPDFGTVAPFINSQDWVVDIEVEDK